MCCSEMHAPSMKKNDTILTLFVVETGRAVMTACATNVREEAIVMQNPGSEERAVPFTCRRACSTDVTPAFQIRD